MEDCLFCKIINGEIPSYKIFEDEWTYSFLDISNDGNGHILVVPKQHAANIFEVSEETLAHVMHTVKLISKHLTQNCGFSGVNVINNNGKSAEQSISHIHFHILPRKDDDEFTVFPSLSKNELSIEEICERLKVK
jgi:histidine triad (HIT) family protein